MQNKSVSNKKRIMAIAAVMIILILSFIPVPGFAAEASGTDPAAADSGKMLPEVGEGNSAVTGPVTFADESKLSAFSGCDRTEDRMGFSLLGRILQPSF